MFLKKAAALLLSAITASCIVPDSLQKKGAHVTMHADPDFTEDERAYIEEAAEMWSIQTNGQATMVIVYDLDQAVHVLAPKIERAASDDPEVMEEDCETERESGEEVAEGDVCRPSLLGFVSPSGGMRNPWRMPYRMVLIPDRYDSHERGVSVTLHEIGHVFGVPHHESSASVMFKYQLDVEKTCLRQPDLQSFCNINVCDGRDMFPCETNEDF